MNFTLLFDGLHVIGAASNGFCFGIANTNSETFGFNLSEFKYILSKSSPNTTAVQSKILFMLCACCGVPDSGANYNISAFSHVEFVRGFMHELHINKFNAVCHLMTLVAPIDSEELQSVASLKMII
jgi:hypothetical protein